MVSNMDGYLCGRTDTFDLKMMLVGQGEAQTRLESYLPWSSFLEQLANAPVSNQASLIKEFGSKVKKLDWKSIAGDEATLLTEMFAKLLLMVNPRQSGFRAVAGIIQSFPVFHHCSVVNRMASNLEGLIAAAASSDEEVMHVVAMVSAHLENFSLGEECVKQQISPVLHFFRNTIVSLTSSASSQDSAVSQTNMMQQCLVVVKTLLTVVQKCSSVLREKVQLGCQATIAQLDALLSLLATLLRDDTFLADCRSTSGMLFALICKTLSPGPALVQTLISAFFSHFSRHPREHPAQPAGSLGAALDPTLYADAPLLSRLYLCHGFLVMLDPVDLVRETSEGETFLLDVLFPEIYGLTDSLGSTTSSLAAARTLSQWVTVTQGVWNAPTPTCLMTALTGPAPVPQKLLRYVATNWDHPVDGIRHQTKAIYEGVLKMHIKTLNGVSAAQDPFLLSQLESLMGADWSTRGKYAPLGSLVELVGAGRVLGLYPGLLIKLLDVMGEHAMATHACEVIEKLFTKHKQELHGGGDDLTWNTTWVVPILGVLSDLTRPKKQQAFIIDYLVPRLLKCHPESLVFITRYLSSKPHPDSSDIPGPRPASSLHQSTGNPPPSVSKETSPGVNLGSSAAAADGRLGALVSSLKTARSLGLLGAKRSAKALGRNSGQTGRGPVESQDSSRQTEQESPGPSLWKDLVPISLLYQALCHSSDQIRIDTIGLLCDSNKTTEEVTPADLELLRFCLPLNLSSPAPSFRQQLVSLLKKLLLRLRESGRVLLKRKATSTTHLVQQYQDFLKWFCDVLFLNISPSFSYGSRAIGLHVLTTVVDTFTSADNGLLDTSTLWTPHRVKLLLTRLTDNYESNRTMAFSLLVRLPQDRLGLQETSAVQCLYQTARGLAVSNRPYHCETAAYILRLLALQTRPSLCPSHSVQASVLWMLRDLCDELGRQVEVAEESLLEAAVQGPMYGLLHCVRVLLGQSDLQSPKAAETQESWKSVIAKIMQLCFDVADVASRVVCNSSPEGFIPSEQKPDWEEEPPSDQPTPMTPNPASLDTFHVTPQMILVCCWRSMKEVSLLLGELSQRVSMEEGERQGLASASQVSLLLGELSQRVLIEDGDRQGLASASQIESIGTFFMKLLKESKHRGAFELAYAGFIKLTTRLWSEDSSIHGLPQQWLATLLHEITDNQVMLCATRRSAGLPFAIQALIGPEPNELGKPCFHDTMKYLLSLALPLKHQENTAEVQVHALNILRALFRDTRLGQEVLPFIAEGVKAAILGFAAKLWAVRNSATMLFSALVSRIFGVNRSKDELARKNCMTGTEFFSRFPSLHPFLLHQLQQSEEADNTARRGVTVLHPSLFPCLLLLSRLYPSPNDGNDTSLSMAPFLLHVIRAGHSAVHKNRSMAAMALVALIPANRLVRTLQQLLGVLPGSAKHESQSNVVHGALMQIHSLLFKYCRGSALPTAILDSLRSSIVPRFHQLLWLASSQNPSLVTRAAFTSIITDFLVDIRWLQGGTHPDSKLSCVGNPLLMPIMHLARTELRSAQWQATSATSCPGFCLWQQSFVSLCLKLRDLITIQESKGEGFYHDVNLEGASVTCHDLDNSRNLQDEGPIDSNLCELGCSEGLHLHFLSCVFPDVKLVTLTHLVRTMEGSAHNDSQGEPEHSICGSGIPNMEELSKRLMDMAVQEEDHECIAKVYEALSYVVSSGLGLSTSQGLSAWLEPWTCLRRCLSMAENHHSREEVLSAILSLANAILPQIIPSSLQTSTETAQLLQDWARLIQSCGQSERSTELRLTVARLLDQSGDLLLGEHRPDLADIQFDLWGVAVSLLQDDDHRVQCTAARGVMKLAARVKSELGHRDFAKVAVDPTVICGLRTSASTGGDNLCDGLKDGKFDWDVLLGLREGSIIVEDMSKHVLPYRDVYKMLLRDILEDVLSWELHPVLLLHLTPYLMSCVTMEGGGAGCIATLTQWARPDGGEPDVTTEDEESGSRLFDKGEANTNSEEIQLRLAAYHQLLWLRDKLQTQE